MDRGTWQATDMAEQLTLGLGVGAQGADHEPTEALWFREHSFPDAHLCCLEVH